ncbi:DRTGG domain-containing protein [Chloroflexota bacterium]
MVALFVTSLEKGSGKTTVCAGLAKRLLSDGKKVGFFKPFIDSRESNQIGGTDKDTGFMRNLLALEEPLDVLCPAFSDESELRNQIREAYNKVSQGKDVVIIEGISDQSQTSFGIVEALNARVIIVEGYSKELMKGINSYKDFGESLLGVAVNKVPRSQAERVRSEVLTSSSQAGIDILGILPEDRALLALAVTELSEHIQGEIISYAKASAGLVENFMLGAISVDSGLVYFGRKENKAVVLRSERSDMQLAALQTSPRCLVISGNTAPQPVVIHRAEEENVPIILTKETVPSIVANIEDALGTARFNQGNKLPKLAEIMGQRFNFQAVYNGLGF